MDQTDVLLCEQREVQLLKLMDPVLWPNTGRAVKEVSRYSAMVLPCSETEESLVIVCVQISSLTVLPFHILMGRLHDQRTSEQSSYFCHNHRMSHTHTLTAATS